MDFERKNEVHTTILPSELQGIPLDPSDFEIEQGVPREFDRVILGDFDIDTIMSYCIARYTGAITESTPVTISNRAVNSDDARNPNILKVETSLPQEASIAPNRTQLETVRAVLASLGQSTDVIDQQLAQLDTRTPEKQLARAGAIAHTETQRFCAAAQLFALTGRDPKLAHAAAYAQRVEMTRSFPKVAERVGPSFTQLLYAIKDTHAPKGGLPPADKVQALLDEAYQLFETAIASDRDLTAGVATSGTPFAHYAETIEAKRSAQQEALQKITIEQSKETHTGVRVVLVDGRGGDRGAFGELGKMRDEHGRPLAEVSVLRGDDGKVMVNVHSSIKNINLLPLAGILNALEIQKDKIVVGPDNKFGGHDVKKGKDRARGSQIVGSPRETGTSLSASDVYAVVKEYVEQPNITAEQLQQFAADQKLPGARVIQVAGFGPRGVPELAIQYIETRSSAVDPTLAGAGLYGDRVRTIRASQIDVEQNEVLNGAALFERYLEQQQPEHALKLLSQLSDEERTEILKSSDTVNRLWTMTLASPSALAELYAPVGREYLTPEREQMNIWVGTNVDRARASFQNPRSTRHLFDTVIMNAQQESQSPEAFAQALEHILRQDEVRSAFSRGEIFGQLLNHILNMATDASAPEAVQTRMREMIVNELSVAEVRYLRTQINQQGRTGDQSAFAERVRPLIEHIKQRTDYEEIMAEDTTEATHIERRVDEHPRKVLVLEIGRAAQMLEAVERKVKATIEGKASWDVAIQREAFMAERGSLLEMVRAVVAEAQELASRPETQEIDMYAQCPITVLALIADRLRELGIQANFGQWINGTYELFAPEEVVQEGIQSQQLWE